MPEDAQNTLDPSAAEPAALARMLGVPERLVRKHIDEGAPTNSNGTINLVHYAAWLNRPTERSPESDGT